MSLTKVANRYAKAFFELVKMDRSLEAIAADVKDLRACALHSQELLNFFNNPVLTQDAKKSIIRSLFEKKINKVVLNFLLFLIEKRRLNLTLEICKIFDQLYLDHKNIAEIRIVSAFPVAKAQVDAITKKLSEELHKEVRAVVSQDPALIGGIKVKTPDVTFDFSFSSQLVKFRQSL